MSPSEPSANAETPRAQAHADDASKHAGQDKKDRQATSGREQDAEPTLKVRDRRSHAAPENEPTREAQDKGQAKDAADEDAQLGLQTALADAHNKLAAIKGQYKAALDDFESVKARLRRDVVKEVSQGKKKVMASFLEVMDNLQRALEAEKDQEGQKSALHQGVSMVRDQFKQALEAQGVRRIESLERPFAPQYFEALSLVPAEGPERDNIVVAEIRSCYVLDDEVLRHGMVVVAKWDAAAAPQSDAGRQDN